MHFKYKKVFLLLIIYIIGIPNVMAESCTYESPKCPADNLKCADGSKDVFTYTCGGEKIEAYCIDPGYDLSYGSSTFESSVVKDYVYNETGEYSEANNPNSLAYIIENGESTEAIIAALRCVVGRLFSCDSVEELINDAISAAGSTSSAVGDDTEEDVIINCSDSVDDDGNLLCTLSSVPSNFSISKISLNNSIGASIKDIYIDDNKYTFGSVISTDSTLIEIELNLPNTDGIELASKCNGTLNIEYKGGTAAKSKVIFIAQKGPAKPQNFLGMSKDSSGNSQSFTVKLCEAKKCQVSGSFVESSICDDGDTKDNDAEIGIEGNALYEYREAISPDGSDVDIFKCLLKKGQDYAGNSVKLTGDGATRVENNSFCSVYCKEDFTFSMPYMKDANAGRYFQIRVGIKGNIDCYTTAIDYGSFVVKIIEKQRDILSDYNHWRTYYELITNEPKKGAEITCDYISKCNSSTYSTTCSYAEDGTPISGTATSCSAETTHKGDKYYYKYTFSNNFLGEDYADTKTGKLFVSAAGASVLGASIEFGKIESYDSGSCSGGGCSSGCSSSEGSCEILDGWDDYQNKLSEFKDQEALYRGYLEADVEKLGEYIDDLNACAGDLSAPSYKLEGNYWDIIYNFDPEVKYDYYEPDPTDSSIAKWTTSQEFKNANGAEMKQTSKKSESVSIEAFTSITNEATYEGETIDVHSYNYVNYLDCDLSGIIKCDNNQGDKAVTKVRYVHKSTSATAIYDTKKVFYSERDDGNIVIKDEGKRTDKLDVVNGLPVGSGTPQGTYFYIVSISNLGVYYSDNQNLGRVMGGSNSVLEAYEKLEGGSESITTKGSTKELEPNEYACTYMVSSNACTDSSGNIHTKEKFIAGEEACSKDLSWDECAKKVCGCPFCEFKCVGSCMYVYKKGNSDNGLQLNFRTISPSNITPNDRNYGYNWNTEDPINILVASKALNTKYEIEQRAISIDVETIEVGDAIVDDYTLKVTMTPAMTNYIKTYNNGEKDGYNNDTLYCEDYTFNNNEYTSSDACTNAGYTWEEGKCKMTNVFCYSKFIDDLLANEDFKNDIEAESRENAKNTFKEYTLSANDPNKSASDYNVITNDYWTIFTYATLDINGDKIPDVGPSWK